MNDSTRTRLIRGTLLTGGAMIVCGAILFATVSTVGRLRHDRAILEWNSRFGSLEDLLARHPNREANATALRLETLSAPLGIDLAPPALKGRPRPTEPLSGERVFVQQRIEQYLRAQLERPDNTPTAIPQEVASFLEDNLDQLKELRDVLLTENEPRWELKLKDGPENPAPNLQGHFTLQKIFLTQALGQTVVGDDRDAERWVEASWRLNSALRDDPVQITQMIAMSITSLQAGTLRRLRHVSPEWEQRVLSLSFRRSVQNSLHGEIRYWTVGSRSIIDGDDGVIGRAVIAMATPYLRLCLADIGEVSLHHMVDLDRLDYLCVRERGHSQAPRQFARWNVLAPLILPNFSATIDRVARLELDLELTANILAMKAARENGDEWPEGTRQERSRVCPDDQWLHESSQDGAFSIEFSRKIGWPENSGVFLPASYAER